MKYKFLSVILLLFFIGCGQPQIIDPCEIDFQKCNANCKISKNDWKETACEVKCETIYAGCKSKQKTVEGYNYIKEKVNDN